MGHVPLIWRHVIVNTRSSWVHGDPRGFRSRGHRIHSSGDYKNPPPAGEHLGLHRYQEERSAERVTIPVHVRPQMVGAFARQLQDDGFVVVIASISSTHLHALARLPENRAATKRVVGEAKKVASRSVRSEMPGSVWSAGGTYKPVRDQRHYNEVYLYILERQEEGAFVLKCGESSAG
jgi:hypothetical protein